MFSPHSRLRHAVADTFAMVVYCSVVGMMIEIFISGMDFRQSLSSRLVAIPVNMVIAWPYGLYRDKIMGYARRAGGGKKIKNLADMFAYVTFQSPVYAAILFTVGADWHQIVAAVSSNMVVSMMMGAAYGYFLDFCRRLFRVVDTQQPAHAEISNAVQ
ncbi:alanine transporter [Mangrovibacter phragmitis]|uniref:L-alanine exporter AlaE n=1 Tax=Mangrovibacter phragmitis TaxID=1691903 RepID=A0A1B7KZ95_9ENTR|nr:L-alanine exporter AlaE [Mangrovibacter phragmitis]OAT75285.1 alanine transporter [Mangrovibacter phragmitis]